MKTSTGIFIAFSIILVFCLLVALTIFNINLFNKQLNIPDEPTCHPYANVYGIWTTNLTYLSRYEGTFICININTTTTLKKLDEVCHHEIGHEIFARECADNFTRCLELENNSQ